MSHEAREIARRAFDAAVARADPGDAVRRALDDLSFDGPVTLLALGKAAVTMAEAAAERVEIRDGVIVTTEMAARPVAGLEVIAGEHPVPGNGSLAGGRALLAAAEGAERVLCLVSGGGSALAEVPEGEITPGDLSALNQLLLASGADIGRMNAVRAALSRLKAGGLARAAGGNVVSLILSDVPGDDPAVIASGPTAEIAPDPSRAVDVLRSLTLWDRVPASVRDWLDGATAPAPATARNVIVGGNAASVEAALSVLEETGRRVVRWDGWTEGDVAEVAARIHAEMAGGPLAFVAGGETTVKVAGDGLGGRNQELALRLADLAAKDALPGEWAFLSGGTDGRDGPTDAAGGIVDAGTLDRIRAGGVDPAAALSRNDAYHALEASGDLLMTGATGTNVADVMIGLSG